MNRSIFIFSIIIISTAFSLDAQSIYKLAVTDESSISIKDVYGDVKISTHNKQMIEIVQIAQTDSDLSKNTKGGRILSSDKNITFYPDESLNGKVDISYEIVIPESIDLFISSAGGSLDIVSVQGIIDLKSAGGPITVKNCTGELEIDSYGGLINCSGISGDININAGGGRVVIADSNGTVEVISGGGSVRLGEYSGSSVVHLVSGNIYIDGFSGNTLKAETGGGYIHASYVKSDNARFVTRGGNIEFLDVAGFVHCETWDGVISGDSLYGRIDTKIIKGEADFKRVSGSIEAEIMSGDLKVAEFYPESTEHTSSEIYCHSGMVDIEYFGPGIGLSLITNDGKIYSNVAEEISRYPRISTYEPSHPDHTINVSSTIGDIKLMRGDIK